MSDRWKKALGITSQEPTAVKALRSDDFLTMPDSEALDVALQLQVILRGQEALLSRMDKQSAQSQMLADELNRLKKQHGEMAHAEKRWEEDRTKLMDEWRVMAERSQTNVTPEDKERALAQASKDIQGAIQQARATNAVNRQRLKESLKEAPMVEVTRPGIPIMTPEGARVIAEEVRLDEMLWVFQPNVAAKVPAPVAVLLEQRDQQAEKTEALQQVLSAENMSSWDSVSGHLANKSRIL